MLRKFGNFIFTGAIGLSVNILVKSNTLNWKLLGISYNKICITNNKNIAVTIWSFYNYIITNPFKGDNFLNIYNIAYYNLSTMGLHNFIQVLFHLVLVNKVKDIKSTHCSGFERFWSNDRLTIKNTVEVLRHNKFNVCQCNFPIIGKKSQRYLHTKKAVSMLPPNIVFYIAICFRIDYDQ